jgi:glycosyltransferase involved in cell wall biosynthesis
MIETTLVVPAYNEEEALPLVLNESKRFADEIVVVDDGSTDRTAKIAKKHKVKLVMHKKNLGKVAAIRTGISSSRGKYVILIDADYTYPARYIPAFIKELKRGADLVLGSRFSAEMSMPLLNKMGNKMLSFLTNYVGSAKITDGQTGYRGFRRSMFKDLDVEAQGLEYETKMTVKAVKFGYKIVEVPIEYRKRVGKSKLRPFRDGYRMFSAIFSILLREASMIGKIMISTSVVFALIGIVFGLISVWERVYLTTLVNEYYPLISAFLILVGFQLFSFGILLDHLMKRFDRIEERLANVR